MDDKDTIVLGFAPAGTKVSSVDGVFVFTPPVGDPWFYELWMSSRGLRSVQVTIPTPDAFKASKD
jgi:hypothetical protein